MGIGTIDEPTPAPVAAVETPSPVTVPSDSGDDDGSCDIVAGAYSQVSATLFTMAVRKTARVPYTRYRYRRFLSTTEGVHQIYTTVEELDYISSCDIVLGQGVQPGKCTAKYNQKMSIDPNSSNSRLTTSLKYFGKITVETSDQIAAHYLGFHNMTIEYEVVDCYFVCHYYGRRSIY